VFSSAEKRKSRPLRGLTDHGRGFLEEFTDGTKTLIKILAERYPREKKRLDEPERTGFPPLCRPIGKKWGPPQTDEWGRLGDGN